MNALRWVLGVAAGLTAAGWLALAVIGGGFRRSFGASPINAAVAFGVPIALVLVVLSVLVPGQRPLLHVTAVAMVVVAVSAVLVLRESLFVGGVGLIFAILWFLYYWRVPRYPAT